MHSNVRFPHKTTNISIFKQQLILITPAAIYIAVPTPRIVSPRRKKPKTPRLRRRRRRGVVYSTDYFFRYRVGDRASINGKISRRPSSITSERTSLLHREKAEKLPAGPTCPSPGPMLPMQDTVVLRVVAKSKPSSDTRRVAAPRISI